ncbi:MAG TPA: hypothetical protein VJ948_11370 [Acidimicrobiia bacterium]|nr:hypothetical protein [Acidimicrobiia bacterium]
MVSRALTTFVIVGGGLLIAAAPVFIVGRIRNEPRLIRSFGLGALAIAALCAAVAAGSERQVSQCLDAGNSDCIDSGAAGLQLVMIVVYLIVAWSTAWLTYRE